MISEFPMFYFKHVYELGEMKEQSDNFIYIKF